MIKYSNYSLEELDKQKESIINAIQVRIKNENGLTDYQKDYFKQNFLESKLTFQKLKEFYDPDSEIIDLRNEKKKLSWFYYNNLSVIQSIEKCSNGIEYKIVKTEYDSWDDPDKDYDDDCYDSDGNFKTQIKIKSEYYLSKRQTIDFLDLLIEEISKTKTKTK